MYVFELHDDEVDNMKQGTLMAHIGRKHGTIAYEYQAEMHLQEFPGTHWRRAYLKAGNDIMAIWARHPNTGMLSYLARSKTYGGEWQLPFVGSPNARIAVGFLEKDAETEEEGRVWAARQLKNAITAILLKQGEICFAWELVDNRPQLISRGCQK